MEVTRDLEEKAELQTFEASWLTDQENNTSYGKTDTVSNTENSFNGISKWSVIRTVTVTSVSFMLCFSAFNAFSNLQSSLNKDEGLGTIGLALIFIFMILTNMFVSTLTQSRFCAKWIIVVSMATNLGYIATGFYPSWYTIIPASALIGVGASHLWLAVLIYIRNLAKRYAFLTKTKEQDRVSLFLGIFFGFLYTSQVWGNLISSLVFQRETYNATNSSSKTCGSAFCMSSEKNATYFILPTKKQVYTFTGICLGLGGVAIGMMTLGAAAVKTYTQHRPSVLNNLKQVTKHLFTSRSQQLLIAPSVLGGLLGGFAVGDFTMVYVSCPFGIENVGFVMIIFGVGQSLCSVMFGKLSQYTNYLFIFIICFLAEIGTLVTLLLWKPGKQEFYVVYILATLFGIGVADNPVVIAQYNLFMKDNIETAQACFQLLSSLGWAVAFGYSSVLCTANKIYILMCISAVSLVCVTILNCQRK